MSGALDLPPGFIPVPLREHRDAFAHARAIAAEAGAGTLVWVGRFDTVEAAVVLEPEEPLASARRAVYAAMAALGDALAALVPPEKPVTVTWPDTVLLDRAIVGGCRLGWPEGAAEDEVPDWLVAGFMVRLAVPAVRAAGPGAHPLDFRFRHGTSLEVEGCEVIDGGALVASFARHLKGYFHRWGETGFAHAGRRFLSLVPAPAGGRHEIGDAGELVIVGVDGGRTGHSRPLAEALARPQWLDAETGEPLL